MVGKRTTGRATITPQRKRVQVRRPIDVSITNFFLCCYYYRSLETYNRTLLFLYFRRFDDEINTTTIASPPLNSNRDEMIIIIFEIKRYRSIDIVCCTIVLCKLKERAYVHRGAFDHPITRNFH